MSYYREDDEDEDLPPRRRRETIMDRRLRKARGEEVDDLLDAYDDTDDDDESYLPRALHRPAERPYAPRAAAGGSGCSVLTMGVGLVALAALVVLGLVFGNTLRQFGGFFGGVPNIATFIATPTPVVRSGAAVVQRIQQLNRLTTTSYTVERVIDINQGSGIPLVGDFLAGDRLLLIAHGRVEAGIDLGKLRAEDVSISADGSSITVRLPPVEIFSKALDNSKTRVYTRDRGFFAPDNPNLETQARQVAEEEILQAACEGGIMQRATEDGKRSLEQFVSLLDFNKVQIVSAPAQDCVVADVSTPTR